MSAVAFRNLGNQICFDSPLTNSKYSKGMSGTPRPVPNFGLLHQPRTFSTKKERGTPQCSFPPRPPAKSAPPYSRIFPHRLLKEDKAKAVSFTKHDDSALLSPQYDEKKRDLYFDQCFQFVSQLGAGSFGQVFKVRSKEDGKYYAIKRSVQKFRGSTDRERKLEEVAKHEKLPKHPNCVEFVKAWEEKQHLYIQTELCKTSLGYYAENHHNIPERLIWRYLVDLLMAVKHLQDHQLVHMDIKPENIFVTESGQCKLGDFGLMLDVDQERDVAEAMEGDPKYMAPELMRGNFNMKADVFSLGITILELATDLDLPRGGDHWHQLRQKEFPADIWRELSPELRTVIEWMLEPDESTRPMAAEVLQHPAVKKIKRRIWRENIQSSIVEAARSTWHSVVHVLWMLLLVLLYPLQSSLPPSICATPAKSRQPARPQDWDTSYSDAHGIGDISVLSSDDEGTLPSIEDISWSRNVSPECHCARHALFSESMSETTPRKSPDTGECCLLKSNGHDRKAELNDLCAKLFPTSTSTPQKQIGQLRNARPIPDQSLLSNAPIRMHFDDSEESAAGNISLVSSQYSQRSQSRSSNSQTFNSFRSKVLETSISPCKRKGNISHDSSRSSVVCKVCGTPESLANSSLSGNVLPLSMSERFTKSGTPVRSMQRKPTKEVVL